MFHGFCFYSLQLVIFAGPTTNSKRVLEYGGNTYGFGSRSVLGSGWPKDLVKVRLSEGEISIYCRQKSKISDLCSERKFNVMIMKSALIMKTAFH